MQKPQRFFPIRYKFLAVLLLILVPSLSIFFSVAYTTIGQEKKASLSKLNATELKSAVNGIGLQLKSRIDDFPILIDRINRQANLTPQSLNPLTLNAPLPAPPGGPLPLHDVDPFFGLAPKLSDEVFGVSLYKKNESGQLELTLRYENKALFAKRALPPKLLSQLDQAHPINAIPFPATDDPQLINRSSKIDNQPIGVLTILRKTDDQHLSVVDLDNAFLRSQLSEADLSQLFLISSNGRLLAHPSLETSISYADQVYPHPIVEKLGAHISPKDTFLLQFQNEVYLCSVSDSGYSGIFAVSQIRQEEAFLSVTSLIRKLMLVSLFLLIVAVMVSSIFTSRITLNLRRIEAAARMIGEGHNDIDLKVHSGDEVQRVAESIDWMISRISVLITEAAKKARVTDDAAAARLLTGSISEEPSLSSPHFALTSQNLPSSKRGGVFWDATLNGNHLTFYIGDATSHGARAVIVSAAAKACISTLSTVYDDKPLSPDAMLVVLNQSLIRSSKEKMPVKMCIVQIELSSGKASLANAGHALPIQFSSSPTTVTPAKLSEKATTPHLGTNSSSSFTLIPFQLSPGDGLLLYSQGVPKAKNIDGNEWGEQALLAALSKVRQESLSTIKSELTKAFEHYSAKVVAELPVAFSLFRFQSLGTEASSASAKKRVTAPEGPIRGKSAEVFKFLEDENSEEPTLFGSKNSGSSGGKAA